MGEPFRIASEVTLKAVTEHGARYRQATGDEIDLMERAPELAAELAAARAEIERLRGLLVRARDMLWEARTDIVQTALVSQANLTGVDLANPEDEPRLSLVGKHFVHQAGVDESLRVAKLACEIAGDIYRALDAAKGSPDA
jgi:hypothetical protein